MFRTDAAIAPSYRRARGRTRGAFALILGVALLCVLPASASALPAVAVDASNVLLKFDTATPGTVVPVAISGLGSGETVEAIDVRPADGLLYGVTVIAGPSLKLYRIDPVTGIATPIGSSSPMMLAAGPGTALDFNPSVDRLRYINTGDANARMNPDTGATLPPDTSINPAAADVIAAAYDRNFAGTTQTTLYAINRATSSLATVGGVNGIPSPNTGTVADLGPLGFTLSATADGGFDIAAGGTAYAALTNSADSLTRLYTINLATGAATSLGTIATGAAQLSGLTILPSFDRCDAALQARGCWYFDELSGTTALDASPSANHGMYVGSPVLGAAGVRNTAVTIDGVDDYVRVPDSSSLDVGDSFTLEGWIKRSSTAKSHQMMLKGGGYQLVVMNAGAGSQVWLRKANVTTIARSAGGVPADGFYHHIVATKNGPNSAKIYIDGVEDTVGVSQVQVIQDTTFPLTFGILGSVPANFEEFAIYDRALTAAEVAQRFLGP